jgi:hypothetical protein
VNREGAIATARERTRAIENSENVGPLCGVPVGIKDLIMTEWIRTTFGSTLYQNFVPECDSVAVKRIKDAGGIILGKTNASEFGFQVVTENEVFGTTRNPCESAIVSIETVSMNPGPRIVQPDLRRGRRGWLFEEGRRVVQLQTAIRLRVVRSLESC